MYVPSNGPVNNSHKQGTICRPYEKGGNLCRSLLGLHVVGGGYENYLVTV